MSRASRRVRVVCTLVLEDDKLGGLGVQYGGAGFAVGLRMVSFFSGQHRGVEATDTV